MPRPEYENLWACGSQEIFTSRIRTESHEIKSGDALNIDQILLLRLSTKLEWEFWSASMAKTVGP
ncbi:uncharacterized protein N7529_010653 [Penicillium soppii]|uniref:uncharacterized protein n=1 Tax=Penicillium soppii TaxID=69789 RepID=UPI0025469873|nr:uncharacterized protein N7529_010653 [Penicillium soppii]KAJ5851268.1 hypothetical protein N7529_010653 [Penicillium soppii]